MRNVTVDWKLLADAKYHYDSVTAKMEKNAQEYADQFYRSVIVPFCTRHKLGFHPSFSFGEGKWNFHTIGGKVLNSEMVAERWAIPTGNARLMGAVPQWEICCNTSQIPSFIRTFCEIDRLLDLPFMGETLGYWIALTSMDGVS